jgi:hypothetical protein
MQQDRVKKAYSSTSRDLSLYDSHDAGAVHRVLTKYLIKFTDIV